MSLTARFCDHVRDRRLMPPGSRVLVACSGGADSTALLLLIVEARTLLGLGALSVAHLDHGLRHDSAADLEAVGRLAAALAVPFVAERVGVERGPNESPEEAARRVRYAFLRRAAQEQEATLVLTAHHADDQAETVLLRILRGTGPEGLRGIPERRALDDGVDVVRPLLPFRRSELRSWLHARGIDWSEDPSNRDGNVRARLRSRGLPALAACVGRDPVPLLTRLAANLADSVVPDVSDVVSAFVDAEPEGVLLRTGVERLPRQLRATALRTAVAQVRSTPPTRDEVERLQALLDGGAAVEIAGIRIEGAPDGLRLVPPRPARPPPPPHDVALPGETTLWDGRRLVTEVLDAGNEPFLARLACRDGTVELADADRVTGPLTARVREPGDRVRALGAAAETRLGHLLQRRGVPAAARDRLPLVCDAEGIVWVAGVCLAERVRVVAASRRIAVLRLVDGSSPRD